MAFCNDPNMKESFNKVSSPLQEDGDGPRIWGEGKALGRILRMAWVLWSVLGFITNHAPQPRISSIRLESGRPDFQFYFIYILAVQATISVFSSARSERIGPGGVKIPSSLVRMP